MNTIQEESGIKRLLMVSSCTSSGLCLF